MTPTTHLFIFYNGVDEVPINVTSCQGRIFGHYHICICNKLEEAELPEGLVTIETSAFYCCKSLKRINLPSTLEVIGKEAFNSYMMIE